MDDQEIKEELTGKEWMRFQQVKWRRAKDNKYFGAFDTRLEAFRCLQEVARRYGHTNKHTNKIKDLVEEYQSKGIMLYPTQLGKWLREVFELDVTYGRSDRTKNRKQISVTMDLELYKLYNQLRENQSIFSRSDYFNIIWRHHAGLDIDELIVYFGSEEHPVSVTFFIDDENGECGALYMGHLETATKKLIESLCQDAELHGLQYVKNKCRTLGYFCFGNNKDD